MTNRSGGQVADAPGHNWVDRWAPERLKPFLRLSRADRPVGYWLLLLPCWWSLFLALPVAYGRHRTSGVMFFAPEGAEWSFYAAYAFPLALMMGLFAIGAIAMRGAGCTYNDIIDRDIDAKVARTRSRPLPSRQVHLWQAVVFLALQGLVGLWILFELNAFQDVSGVNNNFVFVLGLCALLPVLVYPFMKRITNWPQVVLGAAFAWGALMGWAVLLGELSLAPVLLYLGTIFWIIGYDTIYAHQDREDDSLIGLGSTAIALGERTKFWVGVFYTAAFFLFFVAGWLLYKTPVFIIFLLPVAVHMFWQVYTLDIHDAENCLQRFRSNQMLGLLVLLALGGMFVFYLLGGQNFAGTVLAL